MPPRPRSPCKEIKRRLPNYKALSRDLPKNSKETVQRFRYQPGPDGIPCNVVSEDAPGRTTCYAADAHSSRRRTCNLLVDPDGPFAPTFPPGLYLYGHSDFQGNDFVCKYKDLVMFEDVDINTRTRFPDPFSVAVLGPFVHPFTNKLVIKCIPMSVFNPVNINNKSTNLGYLFESMENGTPDKIIMVPTVDMLLHFCRQLEDHGFHATATSIRNAAENISYQETKCAELGNACEVDPIFLRKVRTIMRCFYEIALYSRRWAGPDKKLPITKLPASVGDIGNPLSTKIRNKFALSTQTGVKLASDGNVPADILDGLGMLTGMQQALGQSILQIYDTLTNNEKKLLLDACMLGYPYMKIDGSGYWLSPDEVNRTDPPRNGNPPSFGQPYHLSLFSMYFGAPSGPRGFYAHSSVQGTNGYCVQIAANMTGRSVLTIIQYLYKSRPLWAAGDGPWVSLHT